MYNTLFRNFTPTQYYYTTPPRLLRLPLTLNRRERLALRLGVGVDLTALLEGLSLEDFVSSTAFANTFLTEPFFLGVTLAFDKGGYRSNRRSAQELNTLLSQ